MDAFVVKHESKKKPKIAISWDFCHNSILLGIYDPDQYFSTSLVKPTPIAGYDLDGTIINPKSGAKFPKDRNDWHFLYGGKNKLVEHFEKQMQDRNALVIVLSNQKFHKGAIEAHLADLKFKMENIWSEIRVPAILMFSVREDNYRKPRTGCKSLIERVIKGPIDDSKSFYVGDAAGRPQDHSISDYQFALNMKWEFMTPEGAFQGKPVVVGPNIFNPADLLGRESVPYLRDHPAIEKLKTAERTVVLLVGCPGSGKSFLAKALCPPLEWINQDMLKTKQKVLGALSTVVKSGQSAVLDRQNAACKDRLDFIPVCQSAGYKIVACVLRVPKAYAEHCNMFRSIAKMTSEHRKDAVPPMVLHSFYNNFQPPTTSEGFDQVVTLTLADFKPGPFMSSEERDLFHHFLRSKVTRTDEAIVSI